MRPIPAPRIGDCHGILRAIEEGRFREETPVASEVVHKVLSRRVLYLALFLHDIAKGRPEDHSVAGAKVARPVDSAVGVLGDARDKLDAALEEGAVQGAGVTDLVRFAGGRSGLRAAPPAIVMSHRIPHRRVAPPYSEDGWSFTRSPG
jgi:hypothetical protein